VSCFATDDQSGLADPADAAFSLTTNIPAGVETATATTGSRQVCDGAGNCATAGPIGGHQVDRKAPAISIASPSDNATFQAGQAVTADYSCSDGGSGSNSCVGSVSNGAAIDTASIGLKTFTVAATDNAGNSSTTSIAYRVACDYVSVGVSPSTVIAGRSVRVTAGLRSCSTTAQAIVLRFTLIGQGRAHGCDAGKTIMLTTPPFLLPAGFNQTLSFSPRVPAGSCAGEYTLTVDTLAGGAVVDTASATLTVIRQQ
jgi:hypothetical protein